jgi:hypothetical protein
MFFLKHFFINMLENKEDFILEKHKLIYYSRDPLNFLDLLSDHQQSDTIKKLKK